MTLHILSRTSTKRTPLNLFDTPHDCFKVFSPRYPILFHYIYSRSIISDFSVFLRLWIKFLQIFNYFFPANNILLFFFITFFAGLHFATRKFRLHNNIANFASMAEFTLHLSRGEKKRITMRNLNLRIRLFSNFYYFILAKKIPLFI